MTEAGELKKYYKVSKEGSIIHIIFFRHHDELKENIELAHLIEGEVFKILHEHADQKFNVLVNLSAMSSWPKHLPTRARNIYLSLSKHPQILRSAIVGDNRAINFQTKFILWLVSMNKNIHWFSNIETAEDWFKNK